MDIHFFAKTDVGKVRNANEDYFLSEKISANEFLFIVADGMGGHQAGDVASRLAAETFSDAYKSLRKKNTAIMESMEAAIRKANSVVFEKATVDIEKRGMGTTFSAMIIADMKAFIAHVGDSRVYLIRKAKIKKITTDHSFVEKLVEEGRISPEEAREHPQKNVLYMSLGARESLTPEMVNSMGLEDGDALVLCSDGLSNMVTDEDLMKTVMDYYPEDAANLLVKMANASGGADNITLQIVRLGSLEMLEKTKPIKLARSRKKLFAAISLLVLLAVLSTLWYVFKNFAQERTRIVDNAGSAFLDAGQKSKKSQPISEIDSSQLRALDLAAADCQFLVLQKLHFVKNGALVVFDPQDLSTRDIQLNSEDQVVPAENGEIYLLRRSATLAIDFRLLQPDAPKPLLIIQADKQFDLKEMESKHGKIFKIANLKTRIIPDFINERIFIFHDLKQYYGIKNWKTSDSQQFPIPGLVFSEGTQLFFKKIDVQMTMLYYQEQNGRVSVFNLNNFEKMDEYQLPHLQPPLFIEYFADHSLLVYHPDQYVEIRRGKKEIRREYQFNNFRIHVVKILLDMGNGQKLFFNDSNKLFSLTRNE
ncbi:MAG: Stp1/IreP family PP2C-type Ser/Thr phosphatase [Candidatus Aminicenantes bacterium]|nr:Stp1/IreP family PP2C-type Ser/Thr phosphatase [Candidatus Aminicenantes bacterium]